MHLVQRNAAEDVLQDRHECMVVGKLGDTDVVGYSTSRLLAMTGINMLK